MSGTAIDYSTRFIKSGIDTELDSNANRIIELQTELNDIIQKYNNIVKTNDKTKNIKNNTDYIKIHETEKGRITLHITKRRGTILKNALPSGEIELITATTSNVSISNKKIDDICSKLSIYKNALQERQIIVYKTELQKLANYQTHFEEAIKIVGHLDNWQNFYFMNSKFSLCCPEIDHEAEDSYVKANDLYHPLIQAIQEDELYVSNDLCIGPKTDTQGLLIYGTNAVGKTSYIKSIGIAAIMAQAGLFVPASKMIFKPYKRIMTRIIGNDNIFKGLSTFAVEMIELRVILNTADNYSLILGDELCSGTEIDSAKSIFVSGLQWLYKRNASFIFATHLHEIANYEEIKKMTTLKLKHLSVSFNPACNALVYDRKLKEGPGESMYGLEVCKSLNLPDDFLNNSINLRNKYNSSATLLNSRLSHYNSKKIVDMCEICETNKATDVHHLKHQAMAGDNGLIDTHHKNHVANLLSICGKCHDEMHHNGSNDMYIKKKTLDGDIIIGSIYTDEDLSSHKKC